MADSECNQQRSGRGTGREGSSGDECGVEPSGRGEASGMGSLRGEVNGIWGDVDWLFCKDAKWRPVEPSTFPLANGIAGRVGRCRAYGNAIVSEVAQGLISSFIEGERE